MYKVPKQTGNKTAPTIEDIQKVQRGRRRRAVYEENKKQGKQQTVDEGCLIQHKALSTKTLCADL